MRIEEAIDFHDRLVEKYGGHTGIRDLGLLASAIAMPQQTFMGEDLHSSIFEKGAAYLYHLIKNHPFFDGNKRTGVFAMLVFFQRNQHFFDYELQFLEDLAVAVADNQIDKTEVSILLKKPIMMKS